MNAAEAVRSFIQAWNTNDAEARMRLLEAACLKNARFFSEEGVTQGIEALSEGIGKFREVFPESTVVMGEPYGHSDYVRFRWETRFNDGEREPIFGDDFVDLADDGRIRRVVSFNGSSAEASLS